MQEGFPGVGNGNHASILAWKNPWTEVCDTVQETGIKTMPKNKRNAKKQNGYLRKPYK